MASLSIKLSRERGRYANNCPARAHKENRTERSGGEAVYKLRILSELSDNNRAPAPVGSALKVSTADIKQPARTENDEI